MGTHQAAFTQNKKQGAAMGGQTTGFPGLECFIERSRACPGAAGIGLITSPMSCLLDSSMQRESGIVRQIIEVEHIFHTDNK